MARLPQPGGDEGEWGEILNDYLSQTLKSDGTIKDNVVTNAALAPDSVSSASIVDNAIAEPQLSAPVRTKLNASANAVLLTSDQTIEGIKSFTNIVLAPTYRAAGTNHMQMGGGEHPSVGTLNSSNVITSQMISDPASGSIFFDYSQNLGGSFYIRNNPVDGAHLLTVNESAATFAMNVVAPSLRITGGAPEQGKVLTSDATGNATWQAPAGGESTPFSGDMIKLKELYQPIVGVLPDTELLQDEYIHDNVDAGNYTAITGTLWNSPHFNTQSQSFVSNVPGNPAGGCTNKTNGRDVGSCFDFEFELTGDKFAIHMQTFGYFDTQIYVEHEGQMMKINSYPLADDYSGMNFRSIRFSRYATRRIRIVMPFIYFFQIVHEANAVIRKTPDRPMIAVTGDSYVDASGAYNQGSARSYAVAGTVDAIIEATGFAVLRLGQGGTGYFNNATGAASDTPGPVNSTRFFSSQRVATLSEVGAGNLVALVVNGTINDGELSGGTALMKARALEGFEAVNAFDAGISIVAISPEPINNPAAGNVHDLNRLGVMEAIDEHPQGIGFIDFYNPSDPLWTGTGTETSPQNDQQTQLVGFDTIHANWAGYKLYGQRIAAEMSEMKIPIERAWL